MEAHPDAAIFPLMEGAAYEDLREDVRLHGLRDPIDVWNGQILDGRNRYRACRDLGIEAAQADVSHIEDTITYVVSKNLHRRHLSESQRAMVGARVKEVYEAAAKERQRKAGGDRKSESAKAKQGSVPANLPEPIGDDRGSRESRSKAAAAVNVSPRSVEYAGKVIANGTGELNRMVESGEVSVSAAAAVATLPKPEQEEVVKKGPDAVRGRAKEVRDAAPPMPERNREEEKRAEIGQRWHSLFHDLYMVMNSVRDAGGIERVSGKWDAADRERTAAEIERIAARLTEWASQIRSIKS